MASGNGSRIALQLGLAALVVVLAVILVRSIVLPYQEFQERERQAVLVHERMDDVRTALISYRDAYSTYPSTLDSLQTYVRTDTTFRRDDGGDDLRALPFSADSLGLSPRSGAPFLYEVVSDTTGVEIYWLGDPDVPGDSIGSRDVNPAYRNAASWE